jgi:hypothetical protein
MKLELSSYGLWGRNIGVYTTSLDWCSERLDEEVEHVLLCRDYSRTEGSWRRVYSLIPAFVLLPADEYEEVGDETGAKV